MYVQESFAQNFSTKKPRVKCCWNWHLDCKKVLKVTDLHKTLSCEISGPEERVKYEKSKITNCRKGGVKKMESGRQKITIYRIEKQSKNVFY